MLGSQLATSKMFLQGGVFDNAEISSILRSAYLFENPVMLMKCKSLRDRFRRDSGRVLNEDSISKAKKERARSTA